jgi:heterodisulfide reductase subunit D
MAEQTEVTHGTNGNGAAQELVEEWRTAAYNCFSSGHKFCREVCPVKDVADDYVHCTMCGACELRCPNSLFTGDFYRFRQRTIDVVKAMRKLAVDSGIHQVNWKRWAELTDRWGNEPVLGWNTETSGSKVRAWAAGLDIPTGRSCSPTARRRSSGPPCHGRQRCSCRPRASSSG